MERKTGMNLEKEYKRNNLKEKETFKENGI